MNGQEEGEDINIVLERGNSLVRVNGDDIGVKPKEIGVKIGNKNAHDIAEDKEPNQAESLFLDHFWPLNSAHFFSK